MHGVIIIQGDKVKFRDNETNKHYRVVGRYDEHGFISDSFEFEHKQEVEAHMTLPGKCIIKFSPI